LHPCMCAYVLVATCGSMHYSRGYLREHAVLHASIV
jgi:hypothetical protein